MLGARLPALLAVLHCDIPCGIYDPHPAQLAAMTVQKMVTKILELQAPGPAATEREREEYLNSITRFVHVKEEHAALCKKELLILWTDFFKEEHLRRFPDLHTTFWAAAKLCSANKQSVDLEAAQELVRTTDRVAEMFRRAHEVA